MECRQCGAGLSPEMVDKGACGFCGTVVAEVAPRKHVEKVVDQKVGQVRDQLKADLRADLQRELEDSRPKDPSLAVVATQEVARYTAARMWGCGAGCLSTLGSLAVTLIIMAVVAATSLAPHLGPLMDRFANPKSPPAHAPAPGPKKRR